MKSWLEPARDRVIGLLETTGEINRAVSDAVQEALRRRSQDLKGVNGVTMDKLARKDLKLSIERKRN